MGKKCLERTIQDAGERRERVEVQGKGKARERQGKGKGKKGGSSMDAQDVIFQKVLSISTPQFDNFWELRSSQESRCRMNNFDPRGARLSSTVRIRIVWQIRDHMAAFQENYKELPNLDNKRIKNSQ